MNVVVIKSWHLYGSWLCKHLRNFSPGACGLGYSSWDDDPKHTVNGAYVAWLAIEVVALLLVASCFRIGLYSKFDHGVILWQVTLCLENFINHGDTESLSQQTKKGEMWVFPKTMQDKARALFPPFNDKTSDFPLKWRMHVYMWKKWSASNYQCIICCCRPIYFVIAPPNCWG